MEEMVERTLALLGHENMNKIAQCRCAVLGLGGVGSAAAESLVRLGIGAVFIVDNSCVTVSNLNRQLIATTQTVGERKTVAAKRRLNSINPNCQITVLDELLLPHTIDPIFDYKPHFIIDAIDNITAKISIAKKCCELSIPLYMSMGTGGRINPTLIRQGDIKDTVGTSCSLARVLRRELKKAEITSMPVVYSLEAPSKTVVESDIDGKHPPCSSPFVPPVAGYSLASMAIENYLKLNN